MSGRRQANFFVGGGDPASPLPPYHFLEQNFFYHVKSENIKLLHENKMRDFSLLVYVDSFF